MNRLLARFAADIFWLARYMERAENLARLLDVNESYARDSQGEQNWLPIVEMNADIERFFQTADKATAGAVVHFYVLDRDNPNSIISSVRAARENARVLRHLISTEMWMDLNMMHRWLEGLNRRDLAMANLSNLCGEIKEACQTNAGIADGTLYRDEAWCFYVIGRFVERADQTSRLLDISWRQATLSEEEPGSPADISRWNALLRSAAGYHAFRRTRPRGLRPEEVVDFLICDEAFPRSMANCLSRIAETLERLRRRFDLDPGKEPLALLADLQRELRPRRTATRRRQVGVNEMIDDFQIHLIALTNSLGRRFFAWPA